MMVSVGTSEARAPGFTLDDLDTLLRDHYERGYEAGREAGAGPAYVQGHDRGRIEATGAMAGAVTQVIRGQLNHTERKMLERKDKPKTTIAAERKFIYDMCGELNRALMALGRIEGVEE